jgi:cobaltochelatase CobS
MTKEQEKQLAIWQAIVDKNKNDANKQVIVQNAQAKINELLGKPIPEVPKEDKSTEICTDAITEALKSIQKAIDEMEKSGGVDEDEVRRILGNTTIDISQLSPEIIELINKNRKIVFTVPKRFEVEMEGDMPEIFWTAKADLESNNNVYLYGGAGTGKTYIAEELAKAMNCTLITINCNQYTSPLEIIGGQTIDGYQQGKLITAWANLVKGDDGVVGGMSSGTTGCILLLDELPKIDPNTAGLLNDALAKVKSFGDKSRLDDARGVKFEKKRFYCIATGNSKLNEESADYVANFRQDLSLQDRFAGSTYRVFVDLTVEFKLMKGFLFLFNFLNKVRNVIESEEGIRRQLGSKAFVSIRIMQSLRDTWIYWYENHKEGQVKTLNEGIISFFELFTDNQKQYIINEVDLPNFFKTIERKEKEPLGTDSDADLQLAMSFVNTYLEKRKLRKLGN